MVPFGQVHSWGWSQKKTPNFRSNRNSYGTERRKKVGPSAKVWSLDWSDGLNLENLRSESSPDCIAKSPSTTPLQTVGDVWTLLEGIQESTDSTTIPVVAVNKIEDTEVTITDRTRFLYGYIDGDVQFSNAYGTEGESETGMIEKIQITGIV